MDSGNPHVVEAYRDASLARRLLVAARPMICPFEPIIEEIPVGSTLLDVGCGSGSLLVELALRSKIRSGVGCDISDSSIATARAAASRVPNVLLNFLRIAVASDMPRDVFDVVCMVDVMHHVPRATRRAFFGECVFRLRPGGRFVYKDMNERPRWSAAVNVLHDAVLARQLIKHEPLENVLAWAAELGLAVVHQVAYRKLAYSHELVVFERPQ